MSDDTERDDSQSAAPPPPRSAPMISFMQPAEEPQAYGEEQLLALPAGWTLQDVSKYASQPSRPRGVFNVPALDDVLAIITRYTPRDPAAAHALLELTGIQEPSRLSGLLSTYLDFGGANTHAPRFGHSDFKVLMPLVQTKPFQRLMGFYGRGGDHKELVNFLHPLLMYLADPDAGTIIDSLHKLKLVKEVKFNRAEELSNGDVAMSYETITGASTASGRVRLPDHLVFTLPVFVGIDTAWTVKFELRYVLRESEVRFSLYHTDLGDALEANFLPALVSGMRDYLDPVQVHRGTFTPATV